MSVDASRLEGAAACLHYMWSGPCIILVTLMILYNILGWYALIGLALLIVFIPIQNVIFAKMSKYRQLATKYSDERIKKMQEAIYGIRVIKFYCWEESVLENLVAIRNLELRAVTKIIFVKAFTAVITSAIPTFACIFTFLTYNALNKNGLPSSLIIPSLIFFSRLRMPLFLLPMLASFIADGKVSLNRIEDYMHAEELEFSPETEYLSDNAVVINNGSFDWKDANAEVSDSNETGNDDDTKEADNTIPSNPHFNGLHNLNLVLPKNKLIAVVGPIGSGKSSLLSALVGEMKSDINTKVTFCGSVGYSPQQAWIQNATIRENITFGKPFSAKVYHAVLKACALEKDLRLFQDGDQTEIGEKGVNLSGGQKQRINLARLAYSEADIVLMDDPLSAVDAHVGRHLFQNLIRGYLHNKTRVLVTHQLHFLKQVDLIVLMKDGHVEAMGTFSELNRKNSSFVRLMASLSEDEQETPESPMAEDVNTSPIIVNDSNGASSGTLPVFDDYEDTAKSAARLMAREERTYGSVSLSVFLEYVRFAGGYPIAIAVLLAVASVQGSRFLSDWFAASYFKEGVGFTMAFETFVFIYLCIGLTVALSGAAFSTMLSLAGLTAGGRLFREATFGVLRAPTVFFDTNPVGRIINRFSKDQDAIDNLLPESLRGVLSTFTNIGFALTVVVCTSFYSIFLIIPSLVVYYYYQKLYRDTSRELKRLDNLSKSPLVAQFSETLTGLTTIRAYGRQKMFIDRNMHLLDNNNQAVFLQTSSERWAANRLEVFGAIFAFTALLCSYFSNVDATLMGLSVGYALDISISLNWGIRQVADMESQIVSTERLSHYANNLPREGEDKTNSVLQTTASEIPSSWPENGAVKFENVTLSYRQDLAPVLNNVSLEIKAGERIGIVGRTGAGKSSMLMALFRITELSEGRIVIDGVDIRTIPLKQARSPISIIPQDPVIFSGTVRSNLDSFGVYSDSQLWDALERAHLNHAVSGMEGKLDAEISENGDNLSVGQRQLLCLARALLRRNRILVLDEATANIDLETDALVQKCIRKDFSDCTILTIAHRLNTVIDYDRILVLDAGQVMEFDSPANLLENPNSHFSQLCKETGESNDRSLRLKVKTSH